MKKEAYKKGIVILIITLFIGAGFLPIIGSSEEERSDNLELVIENIDVETIQISTLIPEFSFSSTTYEEEKYAVITLEDEGFSTIDGQAKLPKIRRMVEIPQGATPTMSINDVSWEEISLSELNLPTYIFPRQPSVYKTGEVTPFVFDEDYYNTNSYVPEHTIIVFEINQIRGRRFALVEISPIQYNPATGDLKLMISCDVTMHLPGTDIDSTIENIQRYSSSSFEEMFEHTFANYGYYENLASPSKDPEGFLIIVYDDFNDEITPLANWKTTMGYDTTVTLTSNIPGGATADNIKAYIQNAYDTWTIPPAYILLVGDTPQIPAHTGTASGGETDSYFVRMDGDIFADIYIGRFPADNKTQVDVMVNKTMYYEEGDFPSVEWIKNATFIASSDHGQLAEETHDYVIETHLEPNDYNCTRIYEASGGDTEDISNALNAGSSLCIYSGHGSPSGWGCVPFYQSDVNALTNEGMYPFVCSHACSTSTYEGTSECFSETWLRAPNRGGIAMWGSSVSTYWDEDDVIERRVFDAWWYDGLERIGQMTDQGIYDAYQQNPGLQIEKFIESYNVMGDASVKIGSDVLALAFSPQSFQFGLMLPNETATKSFNIWNDGAGTMQYQIVENCSWMSIDKINGSSSGEQDIINVTVNTTGLFPGAYHYDIIINSDGGNDLFGVYVIIPSGSERVDTDQSTFDRGFPIRHAIDGDWAGAQSFHVDKDYLTRVIVYLRKFGTPEFNLTVELRQDSIDGTLLDSLVFEPTEVPSSWDWFNVDFTNINTTLGTEYFIVVPPAPSGVTTSFGYEWGYCFGDVYPDGAFWFTRDGGTLWRDLPDMYEFTFQTYGVT